MGTGTAGPPAGAAGRGAYHAYRTASLVARSLPFPLAVGLGEVAGKAIAALQPDRRHLVGRHLQRVHRGSLSPEALRGAVRRSFDSYARYWAESFRVPDLTAEELDAGMSYEGLEHLDEALAAGNGVIMALPHLGGWDYAGAWLASRGHRITVVVEPIEPPELFEWFAEFRSRLGLTVVPLGPAAGQTVLRALRANEVVGLVCDRDIMGGGVEVEFFGERTTLPAGPATLALRTGAPLLPTASYFEGSTGHRGVVRPPLAVERTGRLRDDVARVTQQLAHALEDLIRVAPEQWHMLQPNWPSDPGYRR